MFYCFIFVLFLIPQFIFANITLNCVKADPKAKGGQCGFTVTALNEEGVKEILARNNQQQMCEDPREEEKNKDQQNNTDTQNKNTPVKSGT